MLGLYGETLKLRKARKRPPPLEAMAAASQKGRRYKALVSGKTVATVAGPVSHNAWVWLLGDAKDPKQAKRLVMAYQRLKRAGYKHVLAGAK